MQGWELDPEHYAFLTVDIKHCAAELHHQHHPFYALRGKYETLKTWV